MLRSRYYVSKISDRVALALDRMRRAGKFKPKGEPDAAEPAPTEPNPPADAAGPTTKEPNDEQRQPDRR